MRQYSRIEQRLLNDFQQGIPLSSTPFADIASELGVYETTVLENLQRLQTEGAISRVGAVFKPNRIGVSTLAAMEVPEDKLESVASIVNTFAEVNHNYERDHRYNLWFVAVATDDEALRNTLAEIERRSGFKVMNLPMEKDYFIDLGFKMLWT